MGTLTKSTHRQSSKLVSTPPASTPTAAPLAAVADQAPRARRRSPGSVKVVTRMLRVAGARMAPRCPWAARAVISQAPLWASPPMRLHTVNTVSPMMKTRRRPKRSAARPPEHQEPGKGQRVGVDHPLLARPPTARGSPSSGGGPRSRWPRPSTTMNWAAQQMASTAPLGI